jgi:hypothetical protein
MERRSRTALTRIALSAGIPVAARAAGGQVGVNTEPDIRARGKAAVLRTRILIVAVTRIVPARSRARIAGIDRADAQVVAGRAGQLQSDRIVSRKGESAGEKNQDGKRWSKKEDATRRVGLHVDSP